MKTTPERSSKDSVPFKTKMENVSQKQITLFKDGLSIEINSTTQGFLPPRMTTTQRNAIATPAAGLIVYDTTENKQCQMKIAL